MSKFRISLHHYLSSVTMMLLWLLSLNSKTISATTKQIVEVHVYSLFDRTRVVVKSDRVLKYRHFFLKNPERIVVDIESANFHMILKDVKTHVRKNDSYVSSVRVGQFSPKIIRIVSILKKNVEIKLFLLEITPGFRERLFMDFYPLFFQNKQNSLLFPVKNISNNDFHQRQVIPKQNVMKSLKRKGPIIIMLDPGHGGEDYGAIGKNRTREKDVVLQIALRLKRLIDNDDNMHAFMTRSKDVFIPLGVRIAKAKKWHSDLLISIHADAFSSRRVLGSSVFILSTKSATSSLGKYLLETQNTSDLVRGIAKSGDYYVDYTILDMVQSLTLFDSMKFGDAVLRQLSKINKLHKKNVKQADFSVLKSPDIPSILVEAAFISNEEEEKKLKTEEFQQEIAESIFKGIKVYFRMK